MALDSRVAFKERALELGIDNDDLTALAAGGIGSFSEYAFCCAHQPGAQSDDLLFNHLETILGTKPAGASASNYRRLFFERHAMALKDLQSRLERSDTSEIKILPLAEKVQRIDELRRRLPGVMLSTTLEPSHTLIDKAVHQWEENCIRLIELVHCTSREQEIKSEKTTSQLSFDSKGAIKVTKHSEVTECSIQGDIRLRSAFTRRSLAYTLANVASFEVLEGWTQLLFDRVCQEPPAGYKHISIQQIIVADRKLWVKVSEATRSKVNTMIDGKKAVDAAIQQYAHDPEVQFHMLPLPLLSAVHSTSDAARVSPYDSPKGGRGKGKKGKGDGKSGKDFNKGKIQIPDGCSIRFGDNNSKPICMKYNIGTCRANIKPGRRCLHGYHVCWKTGCNRLQCIP